MDGLGAVVLLIVLMMLPLSALIARRLPPSNWFSMALAWLAVFGVLFAIVWLWQSATATGRALFTS